MKGRLGKCPEAGKDCRKKEKRQQRMRWLESITDSVDTNPSKLQEIMKDGELGVLQSTGSKASDMR